VLELNLNTRRGGFHLQLECRFQSEWTVVFGPSGAGKSTLLRLVAGLDRTDVGRIVLDGETLTDVPGGTAVKPGQRKTAFVGQQPALFPHMSVIANVAYGLAGLGKSERDRRVVEMLELVDAASLSERRPRELSGGETQRVALARALAPMPRLLLLDEPFSALDGVASDGLLERLQGWIHEHRMLAVLVTHDATDAYATNAEVALLRDGRLATLGPASEALANERRRIIERLDSR
jgi:ABC-type sulfate/molybdate transport systems ATPase subunit